MTKSYTLKLGDCHTIMDQLHENSVDAIVTDPPYEINFMAKTWDNAGVAFNPTTWEKALRVLKPGGHMLVFGHSRKMHRIIVAIEDAGFEIRDTLMWLYGSGFPKSYNIGKALDKLQDNHRDVIKHRTFGARGGTSPTSGSSNGGVNGGFNYKDDRTITKGTSKWEGWGTALKPAYEPIVLARKPFKGSIAENVLEHGTGGINIDGCRVSYGEEKDNRVGTEIKLGDSKKYKYNSEERKILEELDKDMDFIWTEKTEKFNNEKDLIAFLEQYLFISPKINFEVNDYERVVIDSERKVVFPLAETYKNQLNSNSMFGVSDKGVQMYKGNGRFPANVIHDGSEEVTSGFPGTVSAKRNASQNKVTEYTNTYTPSKSDYREDNTYGDEGSASRFFYCAKASKKDRDEGLSKFENQKAGGMSGRHDGTMGSITYSRNPHPTVKPTDLMQYLVRLITPKGGTVLDPFMGSGSTGKAAMIENNERDANYHFIGIDLTKEYIDIAQARIEYGKHYFQNKEKEVQNVDENQTTLFDWEWD